MLDLSIVIVNWNTKDLLRGCLRSIYEETGNIQFKVFVVDNASRDGSCKMVKEEFPQIRLIENPENVGFARASNQAIEQAKGKYILLLNPDTIVLENALEKMVRFMKRYPKIGAIGCKILDQNKNIEFSCRSFPTLSTIFFQSTLLSRILPRNKIIGKYLLSYWGHNDIRDVDWVTGACLMFRKEVIKKVGLFDENMFMYGEDVDWCYRIKKAGYRVCYFPQSQIIHYKGGSSRGWSKKAFVETHRSLYKFFLKHYGRHKLIVLQFIIILGLNLRNILVLFLSIFNKKERSHLLEKLSAYIEVVKIGFLNNKKKG